MSVGDPDVAVLGDAEACRPAVDADGGLPAAKVFSVGIINLDAGGHVDEINLVAGVDRDGPRFLELAWFDSLDAPDEVRNRAGAARGIDTTARRDREAGHKRAGDGVESGSMLAV